MSLITTETLRERATLTHRILFIILVMAILYVMAMMEFNAYKNLLMEEITESRVLLGVEDSQRVIQNAKNYYQMIDQNLFEVGREINDDKESLSNLKVVDYLVTKLDEQLDKLMLLVYQGCYRFAVLNYWLLAIGPIMAAMIYHGWSNRSIAMYEWKSSSSKLQKLWMNTMAMSVIMLNVYFFLPYAGFLGAYYPPLCLLLIGFMGKNFMQHVTKNLTK